MKKINKHTKGIIVVHMAGYPSNLDKILNICKKYKLKLIEDCAHGVEQNTKKHTLKLWNNRVFSFYPTKQITTEKVARSY